MYIAKDWWTLIEEDVNSWGDFENQFCSRFWNEDVQHRVYETLDHGWYNPESKQKRLSYAINLIGIARELTPSSKYLA